jgi:hypothetical protein
MGSFFQGIGKAVRVRGNLKCFASLGFHQPKPTTKGQGLTLLPCSGAVPNQLPKATWTGSGEVFGATNVVPRL